MEGTTQELYLRPVDQISGVPLGGTKGASEVIALSPRGDQIAFFAIDQLRVSPGAGGPSATISRVQGNIAGASWAGDDMIVFAQAGGQRPGLLRVAASGGTPELVASPDPQKNEREYRYPHVLPDGDSMLFTILPVKGGIAEARLAVRSLRTGEQKDLFEGGTDAVYLPAGYLVFGRNGGLAALAFDVDALEVRGRPLTVVDTIRITGAGNAAFSVSTDGTLVYLPDASDPPRRLIRVTRDGGQVEPVVSEALAGARYPRFAPTDGRLAVTIGASFAGDVWVHDLGGALQPNKLTFDGHDSLATWSPDGTTIAFQSDRSGPRSLFSISADGSVVEPQPLLASEHFPEPWDWSPDGRALIFAEARPETRRDLWILPMTGERQPRPWLNTAFDETDARFSPDGRLIAYATDQSGAQEVWVRNVDGSAPLRVSSGGGHEPVWARDGRELFYQSGARLMSVVVVRTFPEVRFGPVRVLLDGGFLTSSRLMPEPTTSDPMAAC